MKEVIRLTVVLTVVCVLAGLSLSYVSDATEEARAYQDRLELLSSLNMVLPEHDNEPDSDAVIIDDVTYYISKKDGKIKINRALKMKTYIGKSRYDGKDTFHVDYTPYNSIPTTFIRDEIRKINNTLYICTSVIGPIGGTLNPMPFILYGEALPWVGVDEK